MIENNYFDCPITFELMKNPVIKDDSITYDKKNIDRCTNSPITRQKLKIEIVNISIKSLIDKFTSKNNSSGEYEINLMSLYDRNNIPIEFFCPISKKIMSDPVINKYGQTYDKKNILEKNPQISSEEKEKYLVSNRLLKSIIEEFKLRNNLCLTDDINYSNNVDFTDSNYRLEEIPILDIRNANNNLPSVPYLPQQFSSITFGNSFNQPVQDLPQQFSPITFGNLFNQPVHF